MKQLKICIFYDRSKWRSLFSKYVNRTIRDLQSGFNQFDLYIYFNKQYGNGITLLLEFEFNSNDIHNRISPAINEYLKTFPSTSKGTDLLNAPNNTWYLEIVNNRYFKGMAGDEFNYIRACLSTIILERFSREQVDDSSIFIFLIYLQLTVLKAGVQSTDELVFHTDVWIKRIEANSVRTNDLLAETEVNMLFHANKEILYEIYHEVNKDPVSGRPNWLSKWEEVCRVFFQAGKNMSDARIVLLDLINRQLGISDFKFYICLNMLKHVGKQFSVDKQRA